MFELSEKFPESFEFRFECGQTELSITPENLEKDSFLLSHLVLSKSGLDSHNSFVVIDSLVKRRNNMLAQLFPGCAQTAANTRRLKQLDQVRLALAGGEDLNRLVQDHSMSHPEFRQQTRLLYDFSKIEAELKERLAEAFFFVEWDSAGTEFFAYFDEVNDWEERLQKFGSKVASCKLTVQAKKKLKAILKAPSEKRLSVMMACGFFLRREWRVKDYSSKVKTLLEETGIPDRALFGDIRKLRLKELKTVFEKVELSLTNFIFENRIPPFYRVEVEEDKLEIYEEWLGDFEEETFDTLKVALAKLISRNHSIFQADLSEMDLAEFLASSPQSTHFEKLDKQKGLFQFCKSNEWKAKHILILIDLCQD